MRVLLDVDGILADFTSCAIRWAQEHIGPQCTYETITDFNIFKAWGHPEAWAAFNEHVKQPGFVTRMPVMAGAVQFVTRLRGIPGVELAVATSPYKGAPYWIQERNAWLDYHFGFSSDEICNWSRKHWIRADILIDDATHNAIEFPGTVALLDHPWNRIDLPVHVLRCYGYAGILQIVRTKAKELARA